MDQQTIVVSGGSRGLGYAIVENLLKIGHNVATFSRSKTPEIEHLESNSEWHGRFRYVAMDVRDNVAVREFVNDVYGEFDQLDALVNNAAMASDNVLAMMTDDQIAQLLDVNLKATLILSRECIRLMLLGNAGNIINISSIVAQRGFSGLSVYSATKAAICGMTRSLARELGERNIRVNSIAPGYLETEMSEGLSERQLGQIVRRTPLGRLGQVEDIVPWVVFLLSPHTEFVTGQVITVDGGASI